MQAEHDEDTFCKDGRSDRDANGDAGPVRDKEGYAKDRCGRGEKRRTKFKYTRDTKRVK